ncbi:MAG: hypothetical protein KBT36_07770 [Kurthia sp.]|nr:hypothetical protein [Candidatus Kurthia equi]
MVLTTEYHNLLNSAVQLIERNKSSHSFFEKENLRMELQQIEMRLQQVESIFLTQAFFNKQ